MHRVSASSFFTRRLFPWLWLALAALLLLTLLEGPANTNLPLLLGPAVLIFLGVAYARKLTRELADEVYDCGDRLLVRRGQQEEYVAFSNIINVSFTRALHPARITLQLAQPGLFGAEIVFQPRVPFFKVELFRAFKPDPLVAKLLARVHEARGTM